MAIKKIKPELLECPCCTCVAELMEKRYVKDPIVNHSSFFGLDIVGEPEITSSFWVSCSICNITNRRSNFTFATADLAVANWNQRG